MTYSVEIYLGESLTQVARIDLMALVRRAVFRMLGDDIGKVRIRLIMYPVPHLDRDPGSPLLENLLPTYGYARLIVERDREVIYQHPHTIFELIGEPLRKALAEAQLHGPRWGFRIVGPDIPNTIVRPTPLTEGAALVRPYSDGEAPPFQIRRLADPEPAPIRIDEGSLRGVETFYVEPTSSQIRVIVGEAVYNALGSQQPFSSRVEEGGFLIGRVFGEAEKNYAVEVTAAIPAEHTGASLLHFTFTGDSFDSIKGSLAQRQRSEILVGWYHTHLFAPAHSMGLSSIDLELHFTTFQKPWQLAGLINIVGNRRTLRFYVREGDGMRACPYQIVPDSAVWYEPLPDRAAGTASSS